MTNIQRLFVLLLLLAFVNAAWSQETAPKFSATLLLIKADWSASPHAKQIEADLREALKDASVSKKLLDKLPASGPEILFAPEIAALYTPEHHAELMAWLKEKELIVGEEKFPATTVDREATDAGLERLEEAKEFARSWFEKYDENRNDILERDEWTETKGSKNSSKMGSQAAVADKNKDNRITLDELVTTHARVDAATRHRTVSSTRLAKDDKFMELPPPPTVKTPFTKRRVELSWSIRSLFGRERVVFTRECSFLDEVRGQAPGEPQVYDDTELNFPVPLDQIAIINGFPGNTGWSSSFRTAAKNKGFQVLLVVAGEQAVADSAAAARPRLHLPDIVQTFFGRSDRPDKSVVWQPAKSQDPVTAPMTPPSEVGEVKTSKAVPFSATLLLIKADWSASPHAKQIETELREALKDASVPKELLDKLPASGPEILFGPQTVALYSEEHHAELMAWLKAKDLILSQEKFDKTPLPPKKERKAKALSLAKQWVPDIDTNKDGVLTKDEWLKFGGEYYRTADLDKDDILSLEEMATHIENDQSLWAENTVRLSKDDRFIELPKMSVGNRPFVKSQAELQWRMNWGIPGAFGPADVAFGRLLTVRDQVRGQEKPAEGKVVDSAYINVRIQEGRVLVMNAFPAPTENEFRQAARAKGFEAVVMIGRNLDKASSKTARVHPPDWIDDRGDFGHEPRLDWGETPSPAIPLVGSLPPGANRERQFPEFTASLLLVKADWSKSPAAKEIAAEMREALKGAEVRQEHLEALPASATDILFGPDVVRYYSREQYASLLAWLKARSLLVSTEPFPDIKKVTTLAGTPGWQMPELNKGNHFIALPQLPKADQPFVVRKAELNWSISGHRSFESSPGGDREPGLDDFTVGKSVAVQERARGQEGPAKYSLLDYSSIRFTLPSGDVAIINGFPAATDDRFRAAARAKGFDVLVVIVSGKEPIAEDAKPRFDLPVRVSVVEAPHEVKLNWNQAPSTDNVDSHALTKIFHLQHAAAAELRDVLLQLAPADIKLAVDERTNTVIVSGPAPQLAELEAIMLRLDEPGSAVADKGPATKPAGTVAELKQQYADAEAEAARLARESKPAKEKLRAAVAKAFELRQKLLQAELAEFRQRTERIEQSLKQRQGIKQQIIERRVEDLLKPGLEWEGAEATPATRPAKTVAAAQPSAEQAARQDRAQRLQELELQQAEVVLRVAEAELAGAATANGKTPGIIPKAEMVRLQAQVDIARLGVEKARTKDTSAP
jgi:hypothetical protein